LRFHHSFLSFLLSLDNVIFQLMPSHTLY
jgi:hypothetical protein